MRIALSTCSHLLAQAIAFADFSATSTSRHAYAAGCYLALENADWSHNSAPLVWSGRFDRDVSASRMSRTRRRMPCQSTGNKASILKVHKRCLQVVLELEAFSPSVTAAANYPSHAYGHRAMVEAMQLSEAAKLIREDPIHMLLPACASLCRTLDRRQSNIQDVEGKLAVLAKRRKKVLKGVDRYAHNPNPNPNPNSDLNPFGKEAQKGSQGGGRQKPDTTFDSALAAGRRLRMLTLWSDMAYPEKRKMVQMGERHRLNHRTPATGKYRVKKMMADDVAQGNNIVSHQRGAPASAASMYQQQAAQQQPPRSADSVSTCRMSAASNYHADWKELKQQQQHQL
ncbi:hypothetical protein JKP88DRAFT_245289 [Tribonema minus]|uniref:Uncharacterized protein n=1 Tax=Tribonema minus TaxID=303371 RepID=A0A835YZ31_9STRA|nr:hypothetical protein JKP88DRAFT_245289 [Tribonema minus]